MSSARAEFVFSLTSLLQHMQHGGFSDRELPGSKAAEAMRVVKNGAAVTAFAAFERFVRLRVNELLDELSKAPNGLSFDDLPDAMKKAATIGAMDGIKQQVKYAPDAAAKVRITLAEVERIARNSKGGVLSFSTFTFGYAASNVDGSVLKDFLKACGAGALNEQYLAFLIDLGFDASAVGLVAASGNIDLQTMAGWRHESAHDAALTLDASILKTRVHAYLALACTFDVFASRAVQHLISFTDPAARLPLEVHGVQVCNVRPLTDSEKVRVDEPDGEEFFSFRQCADDFGKEPLLGDGYSVVVGRDVEDFLVDWFFSNR